MDSKETQKLEEEFHVSSYIIAYKLILGFGEFILGLAVLLGKKYITLYTNFLTKELLEDPHDLIARTAESIVPYLFRHREYIIFTLIILGLAKIVGSIGLMYKKVWGQDLLLFVTILILPFQIISFLRSPSLFDLVYIIIGIFIIFWLVNFKPKEYVHNFKKRISSNKKH